MTSRHYDRIQLRKAVSEVGVRDGTVVFSHTGVGMLGRPSEGPDIATAVELTIDTFVDLLGSSGTWIVPTYSYSFTKGETFDPATTPSTIGPLSERFRRLPRVERSADPLFSVAVLGPASDRVVGDLPRDCFGIGCVYQRLVELDASIVNVGVGFRYATFVHHVEQMMGVPYRYPKLFGGTVREHGAERTEVWRYYVRPLDDVGAYPDLRRLEKEVERAGLIRRARVGRGEITAVRCRDLWEIATRAVRRDPWFLSAAGSDSWTGPKPTAVPELDAAGDPMTVWVKTPTGASSAE